MSNPYGYGGSYKPSQQGDMYTYGAPKPEIDPVSGGPVNFNSTPSAPAQGMIGGQGYQVDAPANAAYAGGLQKANDFYSFKPGETKATGNPNVYTSPYTKGGGIANPLGELGGIFGDVQRIDKDTFHGSRQKYFDERDLLSHIQGLDRDQLKALASRGSYKTSPIGGTGEVDREGGFKGIKSAFDLAGQQLANVGALGGGTKTHGGGLTTTQTGSLYDQASGEYGGSTFRPVNQARYQPEDLKIGNRQANLQQSYEALLSRLGSSYMI